MIRANLHRGFHVVRAAALALGGGDEKIIADDGERAGVPLGGDETARVLRRSVKGKGLRIQVREWLNIKHGHCIQGRARRIEGSSIRRESDGQGNRAARTDGSGIELQREATLQVDCCNGVFIRERHIERVLCGIELHCCRVRT